LPYVVLKQVLLENNGLEQVFHPVTRGDLVCHDPIHVVSKKKFY
jgi:hypothetical protein